MQHYTLAESKLFSVYCGHCTAGRLRRRRPDDRACEKYEPGEPPEAAFVTPKYLSKALLQHLLSLPLLPEIETSDKKIK